VTRAFGDLNLQPYISSKPDIYAFEKKDDSFLLLATDGFWDVSFLMLVNGRH
jgi:serine/threonine protein phosphatase PrpC